MTENEETPIIERRSVNAARFLPKEAAADTTVVARNVLRPSQAKRAETARERKIAGELPEWEPLPPGEVVVTRPK